MERELYPRTRRCLLLLKRIRHVMEQNKYEYQVLVVSQVVKFGGHVSIDWHQQVTSSDYNWHDVYFQIHAVNSPPAENEPSQFALQSCIFISEENST